MSQALTERTSPPLNFLLVVVIAAIVLGSTAKVLSPDAHLIFIVAVMALAGALIDRIYAVTVFVFSVPLITYSKTIGPVPLDAVTLATFLLIAVFFIHKLSETALSSEVESEPNPFTLPFLLFIFAGVLSLFVATNIVEGFAVLSRYVGYFLLVPAVGFLIKDREQLSSVFVLMVLVGAISTVAGLFDYANRPDQSIGLQGLGEQISGRLAGTFENPNFFGEYLILIIPLGIGIIMASTSWLRRFSVALLVLLLVIALGLTYTRGSWLGLAIGLVIFALLTKRQLIWLFIAGSSSLLFFVPGFLERLLSSFDPSEGTASFRLKLWQVPLSMISDHPITGVGIGNYLNTFSDYVFKYPELSVGWVIYGAHNTYLAITAEMGLLGLFSFLLIIFTSARIAFYIYSRTSDDPVLRYLNAAVAASMVGYLFNNLTSNSLLHPRSAVIFWFLLGVQIVLLRSLGTGVAADKTQLLRSGSLLISVVGSSANRIRSYFELGIKGSAVLGAFRNSAQTSKISALLGAKPESTAVVSSSAVLMPLKMVTKGSQKLAVRLNIPDFIQKHQEYLGYFLILTMALSLLIGQLLR